MTIAKEDGKFIGTHPVTGEKGECSWPVQKDGAASRLSTPYGNFLIGEEQVSADAAEPDFAKSDDKKRTELGARFDSIRELRFGWLPPEQHRYVDQPVSQQYKAARDDYVSSRVKSGQ